MRRFFFGKKTDPTVRRLYDDVVRQARQPVFYQAFRVPDTLDGRFEMVLLHVCAVVDAQREANGGLAPEGQTLFDTFLADIEQNLRTVGVSDLAVPKRMNKVGEAFYGRFDVYRSAETPAEMAGALERNLYSARAIAHRDEAAPPSRPSAGSSQIAAMARYALALFAAAREGNPLAEGPRFPDPHAFVPAPAEQDV